MRDINSLSYSSWSNYISLHAITEMINDSDSEGYGTIGGTVTIMQASLCW
jgi:hypothetical protein